MQEPKPNWELILHRLDDLTKKQDAFDTKLDTINEQLNKVKTIEKSVGEVVEWKSKLDGTVSISELKDIKEWKGKMDEIISPKQMDKLIKEHETLKTFKTQATMVWLIVQTVMTLILFWKKLFT